MNFPIFFTYSRAAVVGFVTGCLISVFFYLDKRIKRRGLKIVAYTALPVVIMLIGLAESSFLCNMQRYELMNLLFTITAGYIIQSAPEKICKKTAQPLSFGDGAVFCCI